MEGVELFARGPPYKFVYLKVEDKVGVLAINNGARRH